MQLTRSPPFPEGGFLFIAGRRPLCQNSYMRHIIALLQAIIFLGVWTSGLSHVESRQEYFEWSVTARCDPHSLVSGPQNLQFQILFITSPTASPQVSGWMMADAPANTLTSPVRHEWGKPLPEWVSVIFPGPLITGNFYCQQEWADKQLHLSYTRQPQIRLGLSRDGQVTSDELDPINSPMRNTLTVGRSPENPTVYQAGGPGNAPYWIQLSIPIRAQPSASSSVHYQFH